MVVLGIEFDLVFEILFDTVLGIVFDVLGIPFDMTLDVEFDSMLQISVQCNLWHARNCWHLDVLFLDV